MSEAIVDREGWIRLAAFGLVLLVMVVWEAVAPRRRALEARWRHDARNLAVTVLDTLIVRLAIPLLPVALAVAAADRGWGVLNLVALPAGLEIALAVILLDLAIYVQHVMFHAIPALWRLHMVHHSDLDFGTTTGVRFHPLEILLSVGLKLALVLVLGPAPVAVLLFEVLLNATSLFNHGNVRIARAFDRVLRWLLVTPDMHRVHHSIERRETNSNFGFNLSWWDRLFGTYRSQPRGGHEGMTIGIEPYRSLDDVGLVSMLRMPFVGRRGDYAIDEREDSGGEGG